MVIEFFDAIADACSFILSKFKRKRGTNMKNVNFIDLAISEVRKYVINHLDESDNTPVFDIFVVWSHKNSRNHKCLIGTTLPDRMYYECTYINNKNEMYLDVYKKIENKKIINT